MGRLVWLELDGYCSVRWVRVWGGVGGRVERIGWS